MGQEYGVSITCEFTPWGVDTARQEEATLSMAYEDNWFGFLAVEERLNSKVVLDKLKAKQNRNN